MLPESENTLTFLEKKFQFPTDMHRYLQYVNQFQKVRDSLNKKLSDLVLNGNYPYNYERNELGEYEDTAMRRNFCTAAETAVRILCDNGVYSKTTTEYVENNLGYKKFCDDTDMSADKLLSVFSDFVEQSANDYITAVNSANAKITGTGCGIITSSPFVAGAMGIYEAMVTHGQEIEAKAEYQRTLKALGDRSDSEMKRRTNQVIQDVFFPAAYADIAIFIDDIISSVLHDLAKAGKFDIEVLDYCDFKKSQELLGNLNFTQNKKEVLCEAFACCPFNPNVYKIAADLKVIDEASFETAKWFSDSPAIRLWIEEANGIKRRDEYWASHEAEKKKLEIEKAALLSKIKCNEENIPNYETDEEYLLLCVQSDDLKKELDRLKFYQLRKKNELQIQYNNLKKAIQERMQWQDDEGERLKEENSALKVTIAKIDKELTRPR